MVTLIDKSKMRLISNATYLVVRCLGMKVLHDDDVKHGHNCEAEYVTAINRYHYISLDKLDRMTADSSIYGLGE